MKDVIGKCCCSEQVSVKGSRCMVLGVSHSRPPPSHSFPQMMLRFKDIPGLRFAGLRCARQRTQHAVTRSKGPRMNAVYLTTLLPLAIVPIRGDSFLFSSSCADRLQGTMACSLQDLAFLEASKAAEIDEKLMGWLLWRSEELLTPLPRATGVLYRPAHGACWVERSYCNVRVLRAKSAEDPCCLWAREQRRGRVGCSSTLVSLWLQACCVLSEANSETFVSGSGDSAG